MSLLVVYKSTCDFCQVLISKEEFTLVNCATYYNQRPEMPQPKRVGQVGQWLACARCESAALEAAKNAHKES